MKNIEITARKKGDSQEYKGIEGFGLEVKTIAFESDGSEKRDNPTKVEIKINAGEDFEGVIRIAMRADSEDRPGNRFFLPGFMYGSNRGEAPLVVDSKAPRLRMEEDFPASPWWMVRSDRLSHPLALIYGKGRIKGFSASPYYVNAENKSENEGETKKAWYPGVEGEFCQYAGFGCSMENGEVWYTLGYENAPFLFVDSHKIQPRSQLEKNSFEIKKGEVVNIELFCFDYEAEDERDIHTALKWTYERFHEKPRKIREINETVSEIAGAISEDAWLQDKHCYSGFVFDKEYGFEYRILPSISWTNGLAAAVPMLASAHRLNDEKMRMQAIDCIEHIIETSINEKNNLPYLSENDGVWSNKGWWYDKQNVPGHAAYLVGQSVYLILKAYALEKEKGNIHDKWLDYSKRVIEQTEKSRNQDGEYPYIFSEKTGSGLEYDSFSGAWCMAAAAYYAYVTGECQYFKGLLKSEKWYHEEYVKHQECYAGPLDIDKNVDSEGILSYVRAVHYMHEMLDEGMIGQEELSECDVKDIRELKDNLIEHMRDALYYEYTFKFCYNSPIKVPPLGKVGWSSCGGSITSVTNPHIHPMSSSIMDEMVYYLQFRKDDYVEKRLEDTVLWSCQCHNTYDMEYDYGKKGWMSERFCHSEGLLTEFYPDGSPASTWFALMPWACGSILEGLTGKVWEIK